MLVLCFLILLLQCDVRAVNYDSTNEVQNSNNNVKYNIRTNEVYDDLAFRRFLAEFSEVQPYDDLNDINEEDYNDYYQIYMNNYYLKGDESEHETRFSLIFPGTKWCGPGNVSTNDNDLGFFSRADACCRQHDFCPDYIQGGEAKYGLENTGSIIKLRCDCDTTFYYCLKSVDTIVANKIGRTYFNIAGNDCFEEDYPVIGCESYTFFWTRCLKYRLDRSQPKRHQWFNNPKY